MYLPDLLSTICPRGFSLLGQWSALAIITVTPSPNTTCCHCLLKVVAGLFCPGSIWLDLQSPVPSLWSQMKHLTIKHGIQLLQQLPGQTRALQPRTAGELILHVANFDHWGTRGRKELADNSSPWWTVSKHCGSKEPVWNISFATEQSTVFPCKTGQLANATTWICFLFFLASCSFSPHFCCPEMSPPKLFLRVCFLGNLG